MLYINSSRSKYLYYHSYPNLFFIPKRFIKNTVKDTAKIISSKNSPSNENTSSNIQDNANISSSYKKDDIDVKPSVLNIQKKAEDTISPFSVVESSVPINSTEYKKTYEFSQNQYKMQSPALTEKYNVHNTTIKGIDFDDLDEEFKILPENNIDETLYTKVMGITLNPDTLDDNQQKLPPHETKHHLIGVEDKNKGLVTVSHILTSAKVNTVTKQPNPVIDESINFALDGKPQRVATLQSPRIFDPCTEHKAWEENENLTKYLNQPHIYPKIVDIIENSDKSTTPIMRSHKDDPIFYTEDGRNIQEHEVD